eukprot:2688-Heterococcus_DN1.PRE.1
MHENSYFGEGFNSDDMDPLKLSLVSAGNHRDITHQTSINGTSSNTTSTYRTPVMEYCDIKNRTKVDLFFFVARNVPCDK